MTCVMNMKNSFFSEQIIHESMCRVKTCFLYIEVSFILSVLCKRFHCIQHEISQLFQSNYICTTSLSALLYIHNVMHMFL